MHTPEEAWPRSSTATQLGLKVVGLPEGVLRAIPEPGQPSPWLLPGQAHWFDTFGLDSAYDYDPVWAKLASCTLPRPATAASATWMPFTFTSITSYVFNHIGFFAERMQRLCKSLFFGGVTNRFPNLNIAFLECGSAGPPAAGRHRRALGEAQPGRAGGQSRPGPGRLGRAEVSSSVRMRLTGDLRRRAPANLSAGASAVSRCDRDEFRAIGITDKPISRPVRAPLLLRLRGRRPHRGLRLFRGQRLWRHAATHLQLGHQPLGRRRDGRRGGRTPTALVEKGILDEEQYEMFVSANPLRLFTDSNPQFFDGTVVEGFARRALGVASATKDR